MIAIALVGPRRPSSARPGCGLLNRSAAVTVPAAFLTMVLVSRWTRAEAPDDVDHALLRLHAPERLGLSHDRLGPAAEPE